MVRDRRPVSAALRDFEERHLQFAQRAGEETRFLGGKVAARFFLDHGQLVDEHARQFEVGLGLAALRVRHQPEEERSILRLEHHELDEPGRAVGGVGGLLDFSHG